VIDITGVNINGYVQRGSYQPYATNLANRLQDIIDLRLGGYRDSPAYNSNLHPHDKRWIEGYYRAQNPTKNPSRQQNSWVIIGELTRLP